jgi:hypothetical protein
MVENGVKHHKPSEHTEVNDHPEVTSRSSTQWIKFIIDFSKIGGLNSFVIEFVFS